MQISDDSRRRINLKRFERSALPGRWLAKFPDGWDERELDALIGELERTGYFPIDRTQVQRHLSMLREQSIPTLRRQQSRSGPAIDVMQTVDRLAAAEWADPVDFAERRAFSTGDFWLNRSPVGNDPLGYDDDRHILMVCGSRSGKGTTVIIPNHCRWTGSLVSIDPSGENATVTAALGICDSDS